MTEISKSIYKTIIYQSIFSCSPTIANLHKWLISSTPVSIDELKKVLVAVKDVAIKKGHIYNRDSDFVSESQKRLRFSKEKILIAKKYARLLSKIPWYRMIAISGAVASYNATENDDIDLFVIVASQRLWFARFFDWFILNLMKVRRNARSTILKDRICINYYLSEDSLELQNKDLYTANEIARIIPLYGEGVYCRFVFSNSWIEKYLANFWKGFEIKNNYNFPKQLSFRFIFFDLINDILGKLQLLYMRKRLTREVISKNEIRFHPKDVRKDVLQEYKKKIKGL